MQRIGTLAAGPNKKGERGAVREVPDSPTGHDLDVAGHKGGIQDFRTSSATAIAAVSAMKRLTELFPTDSASPFPPNQMIPQSMKVMTLPNAKCFMDRPHPA